MSNSIANNIIPRENKIDVKSDVDVKTQKYIVLYHTLSSDERNALDTIGSVKYYAPSDNPNLVKTLDELLANYSVIAIDASNEGAFRWFASYYKLIEANNDVKVVYSYPKTLKMKEEDYKSIDKFSDAIIKGIPTVFKDKDDLLNKLMSVHIPKIKVSKVKAFFFRLAKKLLCA
jgi:hypothetical protein